MRHCSFYIADRHRGDFEEKQQRPILEMICIIDMKNSKCVLGYSKTVASPHLQRCDWLDKGAQSDRSSISMLSYLTVIMTAAVSSHHPIYFFRSLWPGPDADTCTAVERQCHIVLHAKLQVNG